MQKITLRKITSLVAMWSFLFVAWTGITLYFVPQGRIAYWVNWKFLGLTKTQYGEIHQTFSVLFLISMIFHIWLNWKSILMYLKNKSKKLVIFTKEMVLATVIAFLFFFGTLNSKAPFSTFLNALQDFQDGYEDIYEAPPFGHAELLSLENFCDKMKLDLDKSVDLLKQAGLKNIDKKLSLKDLAIRNNINPSDIYKIIKKVKVNDEKKTEDVKEHSAQTEITGVGRMNVSTLAEKAGVTIDIALKRLEKRGIKAEKKSKVKNLANDNGMLPIDFYYIIKGEK